jgi:hypothetical protein
MVRISGGPSAKAMVTKKVCRVIGWALKYRLCWASDASFSSGLKG